MIRRRNPPTEAGLTSAPPSSRRDRTAASSRFRNAELRSHSAAVTIGLLAASLCALTTARAVDVCVTRIDGSTVSGRWLGSGDGTALQLQEPNGEIGIPFTEIMLVNMRPCGVPTLEEEPDAYQAHAGVQRSGTVGDVSHAAAFRLSDGGLLVGTLSAPSQEADSVPVDTGLGGALLPFHALAGIQLHPAGVLPDERRAFQRAFADRQVGRDVLIARTPEGIRTLRGRLERIDADGGSFFFQGRSRSFRSDKAVGVVFASGASGSPGEIRADYPVTLALVDDSVVSVRIDRASPDMIGVSTFFGLNVELPLDRVSSLRVHSTRVVYVSDLTPADVEAKGLVHRPWPVRWDESLDGDPLMMHGRVFDKGVAVHSRTRLRFALGGGYKSFAATIGLHDDVRPKGDVIFRVLGDGRLLYDSGRVTGRDEPRDVLVDVAGVDALVLVVEFGGELDVADHAVWGGARLLKPADAMQDGSS